MGKRIKLGVAKLGERGQSGGAFITGANLRKRPEPKELPKEEPEKGELDLERDPEEN